MTFFQRFKTPFAEATADDQVPQPRLRLAGDLLQERREDLGLDLEEVGAMLRIKPAYLAALEQGRSRDLPGPAYAIGFLRAYADFLNLDPDQLLTRFKAEVSGVTARPDLALPMPLGERSLPGGALVLVALIVALCGYGIWYYLSTDRHDRPPRDAAVPPAQQTPPIAPALVSPLDARSQNAPATSPPAPVAPGAPALFGAAAPANPVPAGPSATSIAPAARAAAPPSQPAAPPSQPMPSQEVAPAGTRIAAVPTAAAPTPAVSTPPAAPGVAAPAAAVSSPATAVNGGSPGTRISIRALSDCWIQVRGPDQSIVFSRVLKSGEVYKVPSRSGLSLRTGNAGALEIAVDGKTTPSIGGVGALRRDVALDPEALAAGKAVHG